MCYPEAGDTDFSVIKAPICGILKCLTLAPHFGRFKRDLHNAQPLLFTILFFYKQKPHNTLTNAIMT